jgi:hypothetical protein
MWRVKVAVLKLEFLALLVGALIGRVLCAPKSPKKA